MPRALPLRHPGVLQDEEHESLVRTESDYIKDPTGEISDKVKRRINFIIKA